MRKLVFLCLLSGIAGGLAAVFWFGGPAVEPRSVAQETTPWSPPGRNVPVANPAINAVPTTNAPDQITPADLQNLTPDEQVNVTVYQNVNRGVVNINTKGYQGFLQLPSEGEGSGSVIDRQGHILTNFHVIDGAKQIQVTLFDGSDNLAQVIGVDPATDIAVLKINVKPELLYPVAFGSSSRLLVGQRVFAIGNPFGFERTLTTGIISSLNRSLPAKRAKRTIKSIIQIDADINPGSSGGPLLDTRGLMIGMNTAIASTTGESAGVGFAIPVNTIARVVPQLVQNGRVIRPESGIATLYPTDHGLAILELVPGGPAEKAGLQGVKIEKTQKRQGPFVIEYQTKSVSDFIIAVDGKPVHTGDEFLDAIESKRPGDQVVFTIVRAGKQMQVPLRLVAAE